VTKCTTEPALTAFRRRRKSVPVLLGRLDALEWHGGARRMFTVELYARIRRAVMVEELHYILPLVIKAELGLFCLL
jgi:hypothetical protein